MQGMCVWCCFCVGVGVGVWVGVCVCVCVKVVVHSVQHTIVAVGCICRKKHPMYNSCMPTIVFYTLYFIHCMPNDFS